MKIFEKKNTIKILDEDIKDAQLSSMDFKDEQTKKRAFIDVLGARLAMKMFFTKNIEANNLYSLYTLHKVLSEIDIADIYYKNIKIDVRLVFNKEEIFIPKTHFKYDILPDIYAVLNLEDDMSSVKFLGYFEPKDIDKTNANKDFYFFENDKLQNPDTFKNFLGKYTPSETFAPSEQDTKFAEEKFLEYIDNQISTRNKQLLIKQLANNLTLREKFVEFENFEILSTEAIKDKSFFKDNLLDIIGAQKVVDEEITEKAEANTKIDNNLEELNINVQDELPEINFDEDVNLIEPEIEVVEETIPKTKVKKAEPEFIFESDFNPEDNKEEIIPSDEENFQKSSKTEEQIEFEKIKAQMEIDNNDEEFFALNNLPLDKLGIDIEELNKKEIVENKQSLEDKFNENLVSFEDILPKTNPQAKKVTPEKEESIEEKIRALEEMEEKENDAKNPDETPKKADDDSSQFMSQVDDFLNDINLSNEQKALLEKTIDFDEDLIQETTQTKETRQTQNELQMAAFTDEEATDKPLIPTDIKESDDNVKDPLKVLFEKENLSENLGEKQEKVTKTITPELYKNKKMVMAASIAGLVLFSTVIGISAMKNSQNAMPQDMANAPIATDAQQNAIMPQNDMNLPATDQQSMSYPEQNTQQSVQSEAGQVSGDMGKAVSDAFLSEPVNATISKIAWEVPEDLAYNDSFRKYLQIAGKNLKLNLQNDLLLTNEMAYSNKVIVDLVITKNSTLQSSKVLVSSGSQQIDKIVLQSVKETIKYLKVPSGELSRPTAEATLIINF